MQVLTLPPDVRATLRTLTTLEISRRYGLPKKSIEIARNHHGIPSPPARGTIQARVVGLLKGSPMGTKEIASALPDISQVGERLKIMAAKDVIVRQDGRWKVNK